MEESIDIDIIVDGLIGLMKQHNLKYYDVISPEGVFRLTIVSNEKLGFETISCKPSPLGNVTATIN